MAILFSGLSPGTVAREAYGESRGGIVSPFAISAGIRFEFGLLELGAAKILDLYMGSGRLTHVECKVVNLADLCPDETPHSLRLREEMTGHLFEKILSRDPDAPNKGRLRSRRHVVGGVVAESCQAHHAFHHQAAMDGGGSQSAR
jgi:hypothetical protein